MLLLFGFLKVQGGGPLSRLEKLLSSAAHVGGSIVVPVSSEVALFANCGSAFKLDPEVA